MAAAKIKPHEILRQHWEAKRRRNPHLSLRGLARRLSLSAPYLSKVLSGKKPLPMNRARRIAEQLELDAVSVRSLERAILRNKDLSPATITNLELAPSAPESGTLPSEEFARMGSQTALEEWYYLPILDFVTCTDFAPEKISDRLGLKPEVAERAWARLCGLGWVKQEGASWKKVTGKIRFPASAIDPVIQKHHLKMLEKAGQELQYRRTPEDFQRRLILGATIATNEESYRKAEAYLEEAIFQAAQTLSEGPADRVYYLALQFFPLTKNQK
jgi:uncharacterized protein (TIGR02147 family)